MADNDTLATLIVRVFDGTRKPVAQGTELLITIRDGFQKQLVRDDFSGPVVPFDVPFSNNLGDNYTVITFRDRYGQAGFTPVKVSLLSLGPHSFIRERPRAISRYSSEKRTSRSLFTRMIAESLTGSIVLRLSPI